MKRIVYIVVPTFTFFMSIILSISTYNQIYVLKKGTIIKTVLIKKSVDNGRIDIECKYNGILYKDMIDEDVFNCKEGDTVSFFYLNSKPDSYVWTGKTIKDFYINFIVLPLMFIASVSLLYYAIKNWKNKEVWLKK
jgi:hypothetical protein